MARKKAGKKAGRGVRKTPTAKKKKTGRATRGRSTAPARSRARARPGAGSGPGAPRRVKATTKKAARAGTRRRAGARGSLAASARGEQSPLVRDLLSLYQELGRLSRATGDGGERQRLREQQEVLSGQIDEAIAAVIHEDTQEYHDAAASITLASRRVEEALMDLRRVGEAINAAARVIEAVSKVLAAGG